jgi:hypothetical protein
VLLHVAQFSIPQLKIQEAPPFDVIYPSLQLEHKVFVKHVKQFETIQATLHDALLELN